MFMVNPEYLSKRGKREFVILTRENFDWMKEALEDAQDLRALRSATRKNAKAPYYTHQEVTRRFAERSSRPGRTK